VNDEQDRTQSAMESASQVGNVISKVGEIVIILNDKRVTLEEKMIRMYLHDVAVTGAMIAGSLHALTRGGAYPDKQDLTNLESVLLELIGSLDELLKMARYDLNFLEQYFEHGYYQKLRYELCFVERLQSIQAKLSERLATLQTG
jgi:hypothetical protein